MLLQIYILREGYPCAQVTRTLQNPKQIHKKVKKKALNIKNKQIPAMPFPRYHEEPCELPLAVNSPPPQAL